MIANKNCRRCFPEKCAVQISMPQHPFAATPMNGLMQKQQHL
jgi:hypothetical protein